ncbi:MAG: DMT family transporter [Chloroflexota bacterium]|nr:DMT family transporter [Chloroflexota bacterium]
MNRPLLMGSALVVGAAALFGTLGFVSRSADAGGMGALPFVAWRAGLATVSLLAFSVLVGGRRHPRLPSLRLLSRRQALLLGAACLAGAVLNIAIFAAFLRTTIAVALICFYTFPAIVTLAAVPLYGERLDRAKVTALLLSSAGLLLVVLAPSLVAGELEIDGLGVSLALFAAVCQAAFILVAGRGFAPLPSLHVATYVVAAAVVVSVALIVLAGDLAGLVRPVVDGRLWPWILAGGITGAAIPTTAFLAGIGLIGPSRAAILMTIEPLVGVALAGLLLGETPVPLQLVGGAAVLAAVVMLQASPGAAPEEADARLV